MSLRPQRVALVALLSSLLRPVNGACGGGHPTGRARARRALCHGAAFAGGRAGGWAWTAACCPALPPPLPWGGGAGGGGGDSPPPAARRAPPAVGVAARTRTGGGWSGAAARRARAPHARPNLPRSCSRSSQRGVRERGERPAGAAVAVAVVGGGVPAMTAGEKGGSAIMSASEKRYDPPCRPAAPSDADDARPVVVVFARLLLLRGGGGGGGGAVGGSHGYASDMPTEQPRRKGWGNVVGSAGASGELA